MEDLEANRVQRICTTISDVLNHEYSEVVRYAVSFEEQAKGLVIDKHQYGLTETFRVNEGFFKSAEYRSMVALTTRLQTIESGPIQVLWGESEANAGTLYGSRGLDSVAGQKGRDDTAL